MTARPKPKIRSRSRRLLAAVLCLSMLAGLCLPVMAAEDPRADVLGRYKANGLEAEQVISVSCAWGKEIRFTYTEDVIQTNWNPETMRYEGSAVRGSKWTADTDNTIQASNRSNAAVKIDFRWEPDAGYEHIAVATSENGFVLASAEGRAAPDSRTATANVTAGSLASDQTDYRLMGRLVMGVAAMDGTGAGTPDPDPDPGADEPVKIAMPVPAGDYNTGADGLIEIPQGSTVTLRATDDPKGGSTYTWNAEGPAEIATEGVAAGEGTDRNEVDVRIADDGDGTVDVSCLIQESDGTKTLSSISMTVVKISKIYNITINAEGEHGHAVSGGALKTDENGVVPALPETVPDSGYVFGKWVDQDGNEVKAGDMLGGDVTLTPMFEKSTVKPALTTYSVLFNVGSSVSHNEVTITSPADASGNPVSRSWFTGKTVENTPILFSNSHDLMFRVDLENQFSGIQGTDYVTRGTCYYIAYVALIRQDGTTQVLHAQSNYKDSGVYLTRYDAIVPASDFGQGEQIRVEVNVVGVNLAKGAGGEITYETTEACDGPIYGASETGSYAYVRESPSVTLKDGYVFDGFAIADGTGRIITYPCLMTKDITILPVCHKVETPDVSADAAFTVGFVACDGWWEEDADASLFDPVVFETDASDPIYLGEGYTSHGDPASFTTVNADGDLAFTVRSLASYNTSVNSDYVHNSIYLITSVALIREDGTSSWLFTYDQARTYGITQFSAVLHAGDFLPGEKLKVRVTFDVANTVDGSRTISFMDGEHGTIADKTPVQTNDHRLIVSLPAVECEDGYAFHHWADEQGCQLHLGCCVDRDVTIHPVCYPIG